MIGSLRLSLGPHEHTALAAGPPDGELVLLLHGWPEFADSWREVLLVLGAAGYRAVAVDQRGYAVGARPPDVADYHVDRLVDDVLGFADSLGADRFHLVAHDWGGLVAWAFASRHPARLHTLSVLATPHPRALGDTVDDDPDQLGRLEYVRFLQQGEGLPEEAFLASDGARLRAAYGAKVAPDLVRDNVRRLSEPGALTATLGWYRAAAPHLTVPAGVVTVPTLYVWGSADPALGRTAAERTADHVKGPYRFVVLEGASHWLPEEVPDRVAAEVLAHLRPHGTGGGDVS